jgi:hypothetical protein
MSIGENRLNTSSTDSGSSQNYATVSEVTMSVVLVVLLLTPLQ